MSDADEFPWAQDLDGVWHLRVLGDEWGDPAGDVQAVACCGAAFGSVHVSTFPPTPDPYCGESMCPTCPAHHHPVASTEESTK